MSRKMGEDREKAEQVKRAGQAILDLADRESWSDGLLATTCANLVEFLMLRMAVIDGCLEDNRN